MNTEDTILKILIDLESGERALLKGVAKNLGLKEVNNPPSSNQKVIFHGRYYDQQEFFFIATKTFDSLNEQKRINYMVVIDNTLSSLERLNQAINQRL